MSLPFPHKTGVLGGPRFLCYCKHT